MSHGVWDSSRLQNNTFVQRAFHVVAHISANKTNRVLLQFPVEEVFPLPDGLYSPCGSGRQEGVLSANRFLSGLCIDLEIHCCGGKKSEYVLVQKHRERSFSLIKHVVMLL